MLDRLNLGGWVFVVNIKNAKVRDAAPRTAATKLCHDSGFALPKPNPFMCSVAFAIPEGCKAQLAAKSGGRGLATLLACSRPHPTFLEVAFLRTVLSILLISESFKRFVAAFAYLVDLRCRLAHGFIVTKEPKYFEIAKRRIQDELIKKTGNYKADPAKYPLFSDN